MPVSSGTGIRGLAAAIDRKDILVVNRTGAATVRGNVYAIDLLDAGAAISNEALFTPGSLTEDPTVGITGDLAQGSYVAPHVVALEAAADDALMRVCVYGLVQANKTGTVEQGDPLAHNGSGLLADPAATADTIEAFLMQDGAGAGTELLWVIFDGLRGLGGVT